MNELLRTFLYFLAGFIGTWVIVDFLKYLFIRKHEGEEEGEKK